MAKNNWILIIGIVLLGIYLFSQPGLLSFINVESKLVQYYNKGIEAKFKTNLTNPNVKAYFNDRLLVELTGNETASGLIFTEETINGTYILKIGNVSEEGLFKIVAAEGNITDLLLIEVKKPFVDSKNDVPSTLDIGGKEKLTVQTFNPQGDILDADSVDLDVSDPLNKKETLFMEKEKAGTFSIDYNFKKAGIHVFKIYARKDGYVTVEKGAITNVLKSGRIHPIVLIWIGSLILFIIFLTIRLIRKRGLRG